MPLGRPITLSSNVASKTISITATAGQTLFQPTGGYRINEIAVYRNGTRLVEGQDFTARDGASVTLLSGATLNDVLEFQIFDSFNIANTIKPNESTQTINGSLIVRGGVTGSQIGIQSGGTAIGTGRTVNFIGSGNTVIDKGDGTIDVSISGETAGIDTSTTSEFTDISVSGVATVGSAVTINSTGIHAVSGVITASSFVGDVTGASSLIVVTAENTTAATVYPLFAGNGATATGNLDASTDTGFTYNPSTGDLTAVKFSGNATGLTGTPDITVGDISAAGGDATVRNITGVAATFTGVLTYEDVTNVDSVGIVTARGGIEIGAAGVGGTITPQGNAIFVGVTTVGLGLTLADNVRAKFGNSGDLSIYHNGSHSYLTNGTGNLYITAKSDEDGIIVRSDAQVELYYNNSKKLETTNTGVEVTGTATATEFVGGGSGLTGISVPAGFTELDAALFN